MSAIDRAAKRQRGEEGDVIPEFNVNRDGNEISMSIEETNKLRASLGLKPLQLTPTQPAGPTKAELEVQKKKEQEKQANDLKARIAAHREKRQAEAFMAVKTLGEADDEEIDDLSSWVSSSRVKAATFQAEMARKRQEEQERKEEERRRRALSDSDDDAEGRYSSRNLAGLKVKHDTEEIVEGETVILTLADKHILTDKGVLDEDNDELENVLLAENKKREKAFEAAGIKAKPLWEEDGKKRNILDKYDDQEQESLELNASGGLDADKARRQEEMRKKLEEGNKILDNATTSTKATGDYLTEAELAALKAAGEGKKKKKKERKIRTKVKDEDDTTDLIAQLEAEAEQKAADTGEGRSELGSRSERNAAKERQLAAEQQAAAEKRARFDAAVEKANWASQALKLPPKPAEDEVIGGDDEDNELYESLARARRQAQVKAEGDSKPSSLDNIAAGAAVKREAEEAALKEDIKAGLAFTETSEFVRNIHAAKAKDQAKVKVKEEGEDVYMDMDQDVKREAGDDEMADAGSEEEDEKPESANLPVGWTTADGAEGEPESRSKRPGRQIRKKDRDADDGGDGASSSKVAELDHVTNEAAVGRGLAGVLSLLKDKGEFNQERLKWAGRNNDKSKVNLQGLGDTYTGGAHEEKYARSIEVALTKKDEYGRILTPKERFREMCYQFHGIQPSKNKQAKRIKKAEEEIAIHKLGTSDSSKEVEKMLAVQKMTGQSYIPLSGKDAAKSLKSLAEAGGAGPSRLSKHGKGGGGGSGGKHHQSKLGHLGGGQTPLLGDRKVEAMLGVKKPS